MTRQNSLYYILLVFLAYPLSACDQPDDHGIDILQDKSKILGCYWNEVTRSTLQIDENIIKFNGAKIYDRYDYGLTGRRNLPTILAWPRRIFRNDQGDIGELQVGSWGDGKGSVNYSFTPDGSLQIPTFPDGTVYYFSPVPCSFS